MSRYGFKLLEIELRRGGGRKAIDFSEADGQHYLTRLYADALASIAEREESLGSEAEALSATLEEQVIEIGNDDVVTSQDDDSDDASPVSSDAVVRIDHASRTVSAVILTCAYGVVGDHSKGIDPMGVEKDYDLTKLATARPYRVMVIAPEKGTTGFLAVEVIGRGHPTTRIPKRLMAAARGHNYKIRPYGAVADEQAVSELMEGAHIPEVRLFKSTPSEDEVDAARVRASLTFTIGKDSDEEDFVRPFLLRWVPTKKNKASKDKIVPADEANSLASYLWPAVEELDFESAEIVVANKNKKRRLRPLDMREGFVYELGEVPLADGAFQNQVSDVVNRLAESSGVDLDDDWDEAL